MRKAFTLIEAMIVIAIVAIMAALVVPAFLRQNQIQQQPVYPIHNQRGQLVDQIDIDLPTWVNRHPQAKIIGIYNDGNQSFVVYELPTEAPAR